MKVSDYVPSLYNKNVEMNSLILSEEEELETILKPYIDNSFKDNFPKTATANGLEKFEKLLGIKLDSNKDNLEYRRAKIITQLSTTVPLSYRWLENNLKDLVGENNFYITLDNNNYIVYVNVANLFNDTAETLYDFYRPLIPANMEYYVNLFEEEKANIYVGAIMHEGERILIKSEEG